MIGRFYCYGVLADAAAWPSAVTSLSISLRGENGGAWAEVACTDGSCIATLE